MGAYTWAILSFEIKISCPPGKEFYPENDEDSELEESDEETEDFSESKEYSRFKEQYTREIESTFSNCNLESDKKKIPSSWKRSDFRFKGSRELFYHPPDMDLCEYEWQYHESSFFLKIGNLQKVVRYGSDEREIKLDELVDTWNYYTKNKNKILEDVQKFCDIYDFPFSEPSFIVWPGGACGYAYSVHAFITFGFCTVDLNDGCHDGDLFIRDGFNYKNMHTTYANDKVVSSSDFHIENRKFHINELYSEAMRFANNSKEVEDFLRYREEDGFEQETPKFYLNFYNDSSNGGNDLQKSHPDK